VVEDGGHASFVLLAGAVDVKVAEADDGGVDAGVGVGRARVGGQEAAEVVVED